jgi:hypothetical protein
VLTKLNITLLLIFASLLLSCGLFDKVDEVKVEKIIFRSLAIESVTNVNGKLEIELFIIRRMINQFYL